MENRPRRTRPKEDDLNEKIGKEEAMPTENLPEVLIVDILSTLPVKSLLRLRSVCKHWSALITDPAFVKMHLSRSLASNSNLSLIFRSSYYLCSVDLNACEQQAAVELDHPLKSPNREIEVLGSCNGLLCIRSSEKDIFLWNPSTRRHQMLPIQPIDLYSTHYDCRAIAYGFGHDPTTDDYKLVTVVQFYAEADVCEYPNDSEVNVYSLSTNSWRRIGDDCKLVRFVEFQGLGVLANSALHWAARRETEPDKGSSFIVSIDLQDEVYREVPIPDFVDDRFQISVGVLGGQLCMLCNFFDESQFLIRVEVWVMKDYGVRDSWEELFSIELPSVLGSFRYLKPICYSKNGEVILQRDFEVLVLYDTRRDRARNLRIRDVPKVFLTETCVGSLVPLNAKDGTERAKMKKRNREQEAEEEKGRGAEVII